MSPRRSSGQWVTRLEPDLECFLRGSLYTHHTHEMPSLQTLRKVRGVSQLLLTIFYLVLLTCPTAAYPSKPNKPNKPKVTVMEDGNRLIIRTQGCRPVPREELRKRMGVAYDETKMRIDDVMDDVATHTRHNPSRHSVIEDDDDSDEDILGSYIDEESELDSISDTEQDDGGTVSVQSRKYMRRKRDDNDVRNIQSDPSFLYQNLMYDAVSKKKSRKKRAQFYPAWHCNKTDIWRRMRKDYFPQQIFDGKCEQKSCFFGTYRCNPVKYALKVLRRDPKDLCNPLPLVGQDTVYEESWVFKRIHVTVACECGLPKSKKNGKRKRGRGRNE